MADAGWYDDGSGRQRWWDGEKWTEHVHNANATDAVAGTAVDGPAARVGSILGARAADLLRSASPGRAADDTATEAQPEGTLWFARGQRLSGLAGGRYRLTAEILYFETGTLSLKGQQIFVHEISDVDVAQSMTQKARGVGDIILTAHRPSGAERVVLSDVIDFRGGADAINSAMRQAKRARAEFEVMSRTQRVQQEVHYSGNGPVAAAITQPAGAAPERVDLVAEIQKLANLRDQGILDDAEFAAGKRKLLGL